MQLSPPAQRVLGSLIEKALATPQQYPLTRTSLRSACNQATGREPVVEYDDNTVEVALAELREPRLVRTDVVRGSRTPRYSHRADEVLGWGRRDQAVLALLLLRGPQTEGELNSRSGRLYAFSSLEEVDEALADLAVRGYVERLERRPGEKAQRWRHLLGIAEPGSPPGPPAAPLAADVGHATTPDLVEHDVSRPVVPSERTDETSQLRDRIDALEAEVADLRRRLDAREASEHSTPGLPPG